MNELIDKINKDWKRVQQIDNIISMQTFKVITEDSLNKGVLFSATDSGNDLGTFNAIIDSLKETKKQLKVAIKANALLLGAL